MNLKCASCACSVTVQIKRANEVMTVEGLRLFLGSKLGKGLQDSDMGNILVARACRADRNTYKILGCIEVMSLDGKVAYLGRLKVARAFRRQSLGTYLLEAARLECKRLGIKSAFAVTLLTGPAKLVEKCAAYTLTKELMIRGGVSKDLLREFNNKNRYWAFFDIQRFQPRLQHVDLR